MFAPLLLFTASIAFAASVPLNSTSLESRSTTYTSPGLVGFLVSAALIILQPKEMEHRDEHPLTHRRRTQYPPIRGWSTSTVEDEPCGGFSLGDRINFPLNGGPVALQLEESAINVVVQYSTQPNPITNQFSTFYTIGDASEGYRCASAPTFGESFFRSLADQSLRSCRSLALRILTR